MVQYKKRDTTEVVIVKKGARPRSKLMTDKQLRAHLHREAEACKDLIRVLNNLE